MHGGISLVASGPHPTDAVFKLICLRSALWASNASVWMILCHRKQLVKQAVYNHHVLHKFLEGGTLFLSLIFNAGQLIVWSSSSSYHPQREAGGVDVCPMFKAVIWVHFTISSLVLGVWMSVPCSRLSFDFTLLFHLLFFCLVLFLFLSCLFSAYDPFCWFFPLKILRHFLLRDGLFLWLLFSS